ncbi:MAG: Ig-like domain-containing protein, partial [Planctomycetota bacterium]
MRQLNRTPLVGVGCLVAVGAGLLALPGEAQARNNIREAFFDVYSGAVGTPIETVPSFPNHCGNCHYAFGGGGPRNPYGQDLETALAGFPSNPNGRRQAVESIENVDCDNDSFSTLVEVTDTVTFGNTPTFAGLTPANVGQVSEVDVSEIQPYLVPSSGQDLTPPTVVVFTPNGGEVLTANSGTTVTWNAADASGIAAVDIYLSDDNGANFKPIAIGLSNSGSHSWFPANRPTVQGIIRVVATDNAFNTGDDDSDGPFVIESPPGGLAPTTLRDFDQPGTQPFEAGILNDPAACQVCHGNYEPAYEPFFNWEGSMMSQASRDILFEACMAVGNQDAPDSGDLCLRCHLPRGWLQGRSIPTDGSAMIQSDEQGVACDFCHRLVDPFYEPGVNPPEDQAILADLSMPPSNFGNGMYVIDPTGARRGPFPDATSGHPILVSPFHREAALCGTCHDVSNPAFEKDGEGNYVPNDFDTMAGSFSAHQLLPIERTYSEWFYSEYNTPQGVFAPQFGGNLDFVATCQDCHMRDVTGEGAGFGSPPTRPDLPLHDMTGGSTWLPGLLGTMFPGEVNEAALAAGIDRARYMLQNAAEMALAQEGSQLEVTVTNNGGHKLPTGYPEGRRVWINVKFFDDQATLISESGAYDPATGELGHDPEVKIYEIKPGLDELTAPLVGVDPGPSFHFVLNNKVFKDNRIPPRGFTNAAYESFGGGHVGYSYSDGQYWDETSYDVPPGAVSAEVTLYYQSTSKEFVEFLRDENFTNSKGQELYDLWNDNDKCPPEVMQTATIQLAGPDCPADIDGDGEVGVTDFLVLLAEWGPCPDPPDPCPSDLDDDGEVGVTDFLVL